MDAHLPRLRRRLFWLLTGGVWLLFFVVRALFGLERAGAAGTAWAGLALLALGALAVARLHDRGREGWWLAAALVPVVGALWLAWELALRRGSPGVNPWGEDPRRA